MCFVIYLRHTIIVSWIRSCSFGETYWINFQGMSDFCCLLGHDTVESGKDSVNVKALWRNFFAQWKRIEDLDRNDRAKGPWLGPINTKHERNRMTKMSGLRTRLWRVYEPTYVWRHQAAKTSSSSGSSQQGSLMFKISVRHPWSFSARNRSITLRFDFGLPTILHQLLQICCQDSKEWAKKDGV